VFIFLVSAALADPPGFAPGASAFEVGIVREIVVLDVNDSHAAVRVVHTPGDVEALVRCHYPGMRGHRRAGMDVWLVELRSGAATRFAVYAPADAPSRCTPLAASRHTIRLARARLESLGLDADRQPQPVRPVEGSFSFADGAGRRGEAVTTEPVTVRTSREEVGPTIRSTTELVHRGGPRFRSSSSWMAASAHREKTTFVQAHPTPAGPVFLASTVRLDATGKPRTILRFTPPLDLSSVPETP